MMTVMKARMTLTTALISPTTITKITAIEKETMPESIVFLIPVINTGANAFQLRRKRLK